MPFIMPSVDLDKALPFDRELLGSLVNTKGFLVTCPHVLSSRTSKVLHNAILKLLYRDQRWSVPLEYNWGMPHIVGAFFDGIPEHEMRAAMRLAANFIKRDVFGTPQPYQIEFQLYRITRPDGSTFDMWGKHK